MAAARQYKTHTLFDSVVHHAFVLTVLSGLPEDASWVVRKIVSVLRDSPGVFVH